MTNSKRFDLYIRASLYLNFAILPPLAGPALRPVTLPWIVAQAVVCVLLVHSGLTHYLGNGPLPRRWIAIGGALTVAGSAAAFLTVSTGSANLVLIILAGSFVGALSTTVRPWVALAVGAVACVASYLLSGPFFVLAVLVAIAVAVFRVSAWTLGVVWELDRSRQVQASLAVAEERLRFARDLHDVVGRTLSVVAIKAELAAQLAKRGRAEAVDEMLEVRAIAQESLAELRAVVGGYRAADLDAELSGARALLASAGIACRVVGSVEGAVVGSVRGAVVGSVPGAAGGSVPGAAGGSVQGALAWVVREGATNVLRHSEARTCLITLRSAPDGAVTLTIDNDGVAAEGAVALDSGLTGLSERLGALGGTVVAERRPPDGFRLTARMPGPG